MTKYPIGIQTFEQIIKGEFVYVDKTSLVYQLAGAGKFYFLSRPRRFGKSLLLSTLEAYFSGRRDLFHGLAIEQLEKEWIEHPIFHIDFNAQEYNSRTALESVLNRILNDWESIYGKRDDEDTPSSRFAGVIRRAYEKTGRLVVILVDEYDKPLLASADNDSLQDELRSMLKTFYGVLKSCDRYIRFGFLTGVTRFSKVSIFSDLNNLNDISMSLRYGTLCGITDEEVHRFLDEGVCELAEANDLTCEEAYIRLGQFYDGYHFHPKAKGVYNPFSVLNALYAQEFGYYWFATGTPTFLLEMIKRSNIDLTTLCSKRVTSESISSLDSLQRDPIPILFQSGYLTIKGKDEDNLILGYPNEEVQTGFIRHLMAVYSGSVHSQNNETISILRDYINEGDPESFMQELQALFAGIPYESADKAIELNFRNMVYLTFSLLGFTSRIEVPNARGRSDMVAYTSDYVYIFEFKLNRSAEEALAQINEKGYAIPYATDPRQVFKIGVNFSTATKNIDKWIIES